MIESFAPRFDKLILSAMMAVSCLTFVTASYAQNAYNKTVANVISGRLITRDGEALSNGRISIYRVGGAANSSNLRVDANGAFTTEPLEAGLYSVSANVPGYVTYVSQPPTTTPVFYRPGDQVTITMIKGGVITGAVKNSNNEPLIAIAVRAMRVRDQEGKPV